MYRQKCAVNIEIKSSDVAELVILIERFILSQQQWAYNHFFGFKFRME
jgi:hypothetical protein